MATALVRPRGPGNRNLLGQLPAFRRNPVGFLERMAREYGDVCYFRLGPQATYLISHPADIGDILVTHQGNFTKSRALRRLRILLGEGLLTSEGEFHLRQRRLVQPAFHRPRLMNYAAAMRDFAARTRDRWHPGQTVDLSEEMMRMTLGIVSKTLFSADVDAEARQIGAALTSILDMFNLLLLPGSRMLTWMPTGAGRRFQRARKRLDETIYRLIAGRRASGEDRGDLLSMLLFSRDEDGSGSMSDLQVRDEAMTLFLAGHETTANALAWTYYLLSENPECERRLFEEVDRVLEGRDPEFDDLPKLEYTERVLAESMRLFPPAWTVGRLAKRDYRVGGTLVPAGAVCLMSTWVVHRDPRWYPEPERFDPERWRPEAREARPKFSYFPFGGGARLCIGERFAWMEGVLALATIARKWRLRLVPGHPVEPLPLVTLRPKYGMKMTVEPR